MIRITDVSMQYPVPRTFRQLFTQPFRRQFFKALAGVNMEIEKGDCVALLGKNGAGKTTLLRLLGGLLYPTQGTVTVDGVDTVLDNSRCRESVGYVINEERSFYWRLTGRQNLRFFGALDNLFGLELESRIDDLISLVGLAGADDKPVSGYSSGMKQRLAIARGLLADPKILLLDEPTKSLDPNGAVELRNLIANDIHEHREKTLIVATHQIYEAEVLCNKVCIMQHGRIAAFVSLEEAASEAGNLANYYAEVCKQ